MADKYATVAGAGLEDGTSWANAFTRAKFVIDAEGSAAAGDDYYLEQGTYTPGEAFDTSARAGTIASPIKIIGVVTGTTNEPPVVGDHATGANRPVFAMEANAFDTGVFWKIYNIDFTGSENGGIDVAANNVLFNCKSAHSGSDNIGLGVNSMAVACEATGATVGITVSSNTIIMVCYIHDVTTGIAMTSTNIGVYHSIIDTCSGDGINVNSRDHARIIGNTIYNNGKGIDADTGATNVIVVNNIIEANTVGVDWTSQAYGNFIDFNCWWEDGVSQDDIQDTDVQKGFYAVSASPGMNGPAGGDFAIADGDNADDAGVDAGQFSAATV